ncbi:MAG TPA: hypothetical protein VM143_01490 [Acidimicrobiales bacterium]|nr:hypothetical protein [Acidimicrobiales bacterium]
MEAMVAHLSAAIRGFTAAQDPCAAAMACIRLGQAMTNFMGNQTAGRAWFARAARLVADQPPCLEQGWVAVAAMGCDVDDPAVLLAQSELALDRARRFGDLNLETKALADGGLALVQAGRVAEGMALLDEAMALACGPADDSGAAARSVCSFFTACYFAVDFERASTWGDLLRQRGLIGPEPPGPAFLSGHCDSVQATLLMELGRWSEAESVLLRAKAEFEAAVGPPSWHPDIALADLRVRQGRFTEAEALLLGKEQSLQALLPAARLHLQRGDHKLALATAGRGLRLIGDDRLRAVELLAVQVDGYLAAGDIAAALAACDALDQRTRGVDIPALQARATIARAGVLAATGDLSGAIATVSATIDRLDGSQLPWLQADLQLALTRLHERSGDGTAAAETASAAARSLSFLDVSLMGGDIALLARLAPTAASHGYERPTAMLVRDGRWWEASWAGTTVRLPDSKGMRYLGELVATPGAERHVLDLVDRVEGVGGEGDPIRRTLGDAGDLSDGKARSAYRHRVEKLRSDIEEALADEHLDAAEAMQIELDALVGQLAQAFGLGGRSRRAASAAERARLNVSRALRSALARLSEALPVAGAALDRRVRTGVYCVYEPDVDGMRWVVQF